MKETKKAKPRRRVKLSGVIFVVFIVTFIAFLGSSIVLKSVNVSLNLSKQDYETQIAAVRKNNETLKAEVSELSNYDRVMNIVDGDNLTNNTNNVFTINE